MNEIFKCNDCGEELKVLSDIHYFVVHYLERHPISCEEFRSKMEDSEVFSEYKTQCHYSACFSCASLGGLAGFQPTGWKPVSRPGPFGSSRDKKYIEWNEKYGDTHWTLRWKWNDSFMRWIHACFLYENAYFNFLKSRPEYVGQLINDACEIYDDEKSNVSSGISYFNQETKRTHIQDIAIRRCLKRLEVWFKGKELVRIRGEQGNHPLSMILYPGKVPFHMPENIEKPELEGWWDPGSVESFYQSNKFLLVIN